MRRLLVLAPLALAAAVAVRAFLLAAVEWIDAVGCDPTDDEEE